MLPPRPEIEKLELCAHGGLNQAELKACGLDPAAVLDFSVCTNPFPPPPEIRRMLRHITFEQYPDSATTEFRQNLSERLGVSPDNLLAGSGTTELIRLVALAYFRPQDPVLLLEPTYGEYEIACRLMGAEPVKYWLKEDTNFAVEVGDLTNLIRQIKPRAVFLGNPNNPTGKYLSRKEVQSILNAREETLVIIDEAYVNFVSESWPSANLIAQSNVLILRSMTKDYALAGLRLGYAMAHKDLIANLRRVCPPWNVNVIAQQAGVVALADADYLAQTEKKIKAARQYLTNQLERLGFQLLPSEANFFLMKVGSATRFRATLLKQGMLVRNGTSFGLPHHVRIAPRTLPECRQLIAVLKQLKKENLE